LTWTDTVQMVYRMPRAARRSPYDGLTASEGEELVDAARTPDRLPLPPIDRYRQVSAEYAERCVRALVAGDLHAALRSANIAHAAFGSVAYELDYQERAKEMRARWERKDGPAAAPLAITA
jgi:hypothetical protein